MKKNNSQSKNTWPEHGQGGQGKHLARTPLTSAERVLAVLFGFGFILGFLLTPLGVETRSPKYGPWRLQGFHNRGIVNSVCWAGFAVAAKNKVRRVLDVIGATLIFLTTPADQALFFFTVSPPPAVTTSLC